MRAKKKERKKQKKKRKEKENVKCENVRKNIKIIGLSKINMAIGYFEDLTKY